MLFTIITVTYNAEHTVERTLQSVSRQTMTDYEHLIIDGASTDATLTIVDQYKTERMRVVSEPDKGLYDAMNKAIGLATGEYLIFLNAGDEFAAPDVLQRLAEAAGADVIYGQTRLVDDAGNVLGMRHLSAPEMLNKRSFLRGMLVCHQAFVARRKIVPFYDTSYRFSADYDWCVKVLGKASLTRYVGDKPVVNFLVGGTTTKNKWASLKERYRIMCHHYGVIAASLSHISFIPRAVARRLKSNKPCKNNQ